VPQHPADAWRSRFERRHQEQFRSTPVPDLSIPELLAVVRSAPASPIRWTQRERQAWRELSLRG
jgi:hypothetical protein